MIVLKQVTLKNFLSYGKIPTEIQLNEKSFVGLFAPNGSGKTTISYAILFTLYGKATSESLDDLVNFTNKKQLETSVTFFKEGAGFYKVVRCRKMSGTSSNYVKFYHNATEEIFEQSHEITLDSIKNTDQLITSVIGLDYDMFCRTVVISTNHEDFLSLPKTSSNNKPSQQSFLEQLFELDILNEKAVKLKDSIKESEQLVKNHITKIEYILKEHEMVEMQIKNAKQKSSEHHLMVNENIEKYQTQLKRIDYIDFEKEKQNIEVSSNIKAELQAFKQEHKEISYKINNIVDKKKQLQLQIDTLTNKSKEHDLNVKDNINKFNDKLKTLLQIDIDMERQYIELSNKVKQELLDIKSTMKDLNEHYKQHKAIKDSTMLELDSLNSSKCPRCDQHYFNEEDIKKCQNIVQESDIKITELYEQLTKLSETKNNKMADYENYTSKVSVNGLEDLITIQNNIEKIKDKISDLSSSNNVYAEQLNELLVKVDDNDNEKELEHLFKRLEDLNNDLSSKKEAYDSIIEQSTITDIEELTTLKNRVEHIKEKINDLYNSKNVYSEQLDDLKKTQKSLEKADYESLDKFKNILEHQQFLYRLLVKKDSFVRKNLLSNNLKYLNSRISEYLQALEFPYSITFEPDMTATITSLGRSISFGNLSKGQKSRVNIALMIAFTDIKRKNTNNMNLLILDEILDAGLDHTGLKSVIRLLKHKAYAENLNLVVVSHQSAVKESFDDVISISLVDGFSKLSYSWK